MLETLTMFPLLTLRWGIASWLSLSALFRLIWGQIVWHNIENTDWHTTTQRSGLIVISNIATQWATDWHTRTDRVPRSVLIVIVNLHALVHLLHADREKIRGQKNSSVVHENVQAFQKLAFTKTKLKTCLQDETQFHLLLVHKPAKRVNNIYRQSDN